MNIQNKKSIARLAVIGLIIVSAIFLAGFARAQDVVSAPTTEVKAQSPLQGITFPIPELGNCTDRVACKAYCSDSANISSCTDFARAHGLVTKEAGERAKKFGETIRAGNGPGGCTSPDACKKFCGDFRNITVCTAFAEKNGVKIPENDPGRKLAEYLAVGGTTPGGCTSRETCEAYCKDLTHADECTIFRAKIGLASPDDARIKKIGELMRSGETPGKCASKDACEAYCKDQTHFADCAVFALKAGLVSASEAKRFATSTPPIGPGGCTSRDACEAYCKDDDHRDECYAFAEERGVLKKEEVQDAKNGLVRLKAGLEGAPTEVRACITTVLGGATVSNIQSGNFVPGGEVAQSIKKCFEQFGAPTTPRTVFKEVSSSTLGCVKEMLGDDFTTFSTGEAEMSPEVADLLRGCRQEIMPRGNPAQDRGMKPTLPPMPLRVGSGTTNGVVPVPPSLRTCVLQKLGRTDGDTAILATLSPEALKAATEKCMQELRPMPVPGGSGPTSPQPTMPQKPGGVQGQLPAGLVPEVVACLRKQLGEEGARKLLAGETTPEAAKAIELCRMNRMMPQNMQPGTGSEPPDRMMRAPLPMPPMRVPIEGGDAMPQNSVPSSVNVGPLPPALILTTPIQPFIKFILGL